MAHTFAVTVAGRNRVHEIPNKCPICHHKVTIQGAQNMNVRDKEVQALFLCPNLDCRNYFVAYYELRADERMILTGLIPSKVELEHFPDSVTSISPTFLSIYQEAASARAMGLHQIAGPGYRKAFEFLIKDYATFKSPDDRGTIEQEFSGNVIKKYISDPRIQGVAERALWLGNDETHFLRKWKEHDIDDLITLIRLALNWIDIEHLSDEYTSKMGKSGSVGG